MPRITAKSRSISTAPIIVGVVVALLLLFGIWRRFVIEKKAPPEAAPVADETNADPFGHTLPKIGGLPGYASSSSCIDCHPREHESWRRSYHSSMTQLMSPETVQADFNNVSMDFQGERFTLRRSGEEFWVTIEAVESISDTMAQDRVIAPGVDPEAIHVRLGMVTGSHHMQVFWMPGLMGNMQIGFPFTWLIHDRRWAPRNSVFIRDPKVIQSKEVWNGVCIRCHTTGAVPRPDPEQRIYDTRVADLGISCEACHGPGEAHVKHQQSLVAQGQPSDTDDSSIVQPANLDPLRSSQVCGFCHSMKWFDKNERWETKGFRFRPCCNLLHGSWSQGRF